MRAMHQSACDTHQPKSASLGANRYASDLPFLLQAISLVLKLDLQPLMDLALNEASAGLIAW